MANSREFSNIDNHYDILGENRLRFNAAAGVFYSQGNTEPLLSFLKTMQPHHIHSFMGSTVNIQQLDQPLIVYRTGKVGKYWTQALPNSPWQQCLEMAMHPALYPSTMKEVCNFHPANQNVLMYQIPAGTVIASGACAPQSGSFCGGSQIFLPQVDASKVRSTDWGQWIENSRSALAYTTHWDNICIAGIPIHFENAAAKDALLHTLPRVARNPATGVQTVLNLMRNGASQDQIRVYGFDLAQMANDASSIAYVPQRGLQRVLLQTQNSMNLYCDAVHEFSHATLPLARRNPELNSLYNEFAPQLRQALCADYWEYRDKRHLLAPIQNRVANWVFNQPQTYPKEEWLSERIAFGVQALAESEKALASVAPRFTRTLNHYINVVANTPAPPFAPDSASAPKARYLPVHHSTPQAKFAEPTPLLTYPSKPHSAYRYGQFTYEGPMNVNGQMIQVRLAKTGVYRFENGRLVFERWCNPSCEVLPPKSLPYHQPRPINWRQLNTGISAGLMAWNAYSTYQSQDPSHGVLKNTWNTAMTLTADTIGYSPLIALTAELGLPYASLPIILLAAAPDVKPKFEETTQRLFNTRPKNAGEILMQSDLMDQAMDLGMTMWAQKAARAAVKLCAQASAMIKRGMIDNGIMDAPRSEAFTPPAMPNDKLMTMALAPTVLAPKPLIQENPWKAPPSPLPVQALPPGQQIQHALANAKPASLVFYDQQVKERQQWQLERDNCLALAHQYRTKKPDLALSAAKPRHITEISWDELGPDRINELNIQDGGANHFDPLPSFNGGRQETAADDKRLSGLDQVVKVDDPTLLHAEVEDKTEPLTHHNTHLKPRSASRPKPDRPSWLPTAAYAGASMGEYWLVLEFGLTWTTLGIGAGALAVMEIAFSWMRRHEKKEIKRAERRDERCRQQCGQIDKELALADTKVNEAMGLFNQYLVEKDPIKKHQLRGSLNILLQDAQTINETNEKRIIYWSHTKNASIQAQGHHPHEIIHDAKKFAQHILANGHYGRNKETLGECRDYLSIDDASLTSLLARIDKEPVNNKRFYICARIANIIKTSLQPEEAKLFTQQAKMLFDSNPNNAENKIIYTESLLKAGNVALIQGEHEQARSYFATTLTVTNNNIEARCGLFLTDVHANKPLSELMASVSELDQHLHAFLKGRPIEALTTTELQVYLVNCENIKQAKLRLNSHTVSTYQRLANSDQLGKAEGLLLLNTNLSDQDKMQCLIFKATAELKGNQPESSMESYRQILLRNPQDLSAQCGLLLAEALAGKPIAYLHEQLTAIKNGLKNARLSAEETADLAKLEKHINNQTLLEFDALIQSGKITEALNCLVSSHLALEVKAAMAKHSAESAAILLKNARQKRLDEANDLLAKKQFTAAIDAYNDLLVSDGNHFLAKCGKLMCEIGLVENQQEALPKLYASFNALQADYCNRQLTPEEQATYKLNLDNLKQIVDSMTLIVCNRHLEQLAFDAAIATLESSILDPETKAKNVAAIRYGKDRYYTGNTLAIIETSLKLAWELARIYQDYINQPKYYAPIVRLKSVDLSAHPSLPAAATARGPRHLPKPAATLPLATRTLEHAVEIRSTVRAVNKSPALFKQDEVKKISKTPQNLQKRF